jgi:methyltransferase
MTWAAVAILAFVTLQRLAELRFAERNRRRLLAMGAIEHAPGHYAFIVALHMAWLAALWWWAPGRAIQIPLLLLFLLLQIARLWIIVTLGQRWTTRIIVLPDAPMIKHGPYRFIEHPNYLVVALEIALLPLVFGLVKIALIFSVLNAVLLAIRIRAENQALRR